MNLRSHWRVLLWLTAGGLFVWVLSSVSLAGVLGVLAKLDRGEVAVLVALNAVALLLFGVRWWWILKGLGHPIPFLHACLYRLAAFGFAYFTPGPLVGGEPAQVLLAEKRDGLARDVAIASVGLDRLFEGVVHLGFLAAAAFALATGPGAFFLAVLVSLPLGYLVALGLGYAPLSRVIRRDVIRTSEIAAGRFCRERPVHVLGAVVASIAGWSLVIVEYWLVLSFLGAELGFRQVLLGWVASRIAYLLFLPAGLGVLEAGQVLAFRNMGLAAEMGLSVSLLIRLRDVAVASAGLWSGVRMLTHPKKRTRSI